MFDDLRKTYPEIQGWSDDKISGHIEKKYGISGAAMMQPNALLAAIQEKRGEKPPEKIDRSLMGSVAAGIEDRVYGLGQGGLDAIGIAAKGLGVDDSLGGVALHDYSKAKSIPDTYFMGLPINLYGPSAWRKAKQSGSVKEADVAASKSLTESRRKVGYKPYVSWDEVKQDPSAGNISAFILESALVSLPDMAALLSGPLGMGSYVTARSGEIAKERARRDGDREATGEDLIKAIPTAGLIAALDRVGLTGMLGISKGASRKAVMEALKGGGKKAAAQFGKQVGIAGGKEAGTEAAQELAEYATTTLGTKTPWDTSELTDRLAQAAVVGGPFGATVRGIGAGATVGKAAHARAQAPKRIRKAMTSVQDMQALAEDYTGASPKGPAVIVPEQEKGAVARAAGAVGRGAAKVADAVTDPLAAVMRAPGDYIRSITGWDEKADAAIETLRKAAGAAKSAVIDPIRQKTGRGDATAGEGVLDPYANLTRKERQRFQGNVKYPGLGLMARVDNATGDIFKVLESAPDEIKAQVQGYLTTKGADPGMITDPRYSDLAAALKQTIDQIGRGMVEKGWMTQESYIKYKDSYLRNVYQQHFDTLMKQGFIDRSFTKKRSDTLSEDVRKNDLGQIEDPSITATVSIAGPMRALVKEHIARQVADDPSLSYKPSEFEVEGAHSNVVLKSHVQAMHALAGQAADPTVQANVSALAQQAESIPTGEGTLNTAEEQRTYKAYQRLLRRVSGEIKDADVAAGVAQEADRIGHMLNRKMTSDVAEAEARRLDAQAEEVTDPEVKAEMLARAHRMRTQARKAGDVMPEEAHKYQRLPDKPEWGELRGMHVKKDVYRQLVGNFEMLVNDTSTSELGKAVSRAMSYWKVGKVVTNVPTVFRNVMSNIILMNMAGMPLAAVPGRVSQAVSSMALGTKYWKEAQRLGLTETSLAHNEFVSIGKRWRRKSISSPWQLLGRMTTDAFSKFSEAYGGIENVFKMAVYIDARKTGSSPNAAMIKAQEALFDYSEVTPAIDKVRRSPFGSPFATFQLKAANRLVETAIRRPVLAGMWGTTIYYAAQGLLQSALSGMDEEDYARLKGAAPKWIADNEGAVPLPFKDKSGRWVFIDLSYILPWGWAVKSTKAFAKGDVFGGLGEAGAMSIGPGSSLVAAGLTGVDPFTRRKVEDWTTHLWNLTMPTMVTEHGTPNKLVDAYEGRGTKWERQPRRSVEQAWAAVGGINTYPIRPEQSRLWNIRAMKNQVSQLRRKQSVKIKQAQNIYYQDPAIADREVEKIKEEYGPRIRELYQKMVEYRAGSRLPKRLWTQEDLPRDLRRKRILDLRWERRNKRRIQAN